MLGGQQFHAYRTIMSKSRYLPAHSALDVRLFRLIVWVPTIIVATFTAAIVGTKIARVYVEIGPEFLFVLLQMLAFLFLWWWIDVAPVISRWLVAIVATAVPVSACILLTRATLTNDEAFGFDIHITSSLAAEIAQYVAIVSYPCAVAVEAWRQILTRRKPNPPEPDTAR